MPSPREPESQVNVVLGAQWGDEGKGKLVDFLAEKADVVARCQGGNNAGHTVVVDEKAYDFHMLPSGIIWPQCTSVIGNGVVIHLPNLFDEISKNEAKGLSNWESRLKISDKAHLVFDFHQSVDGIQEAERTDSQLTSGKLGTTKKGIGPTYASKAYRNGIRVSDLVYGNFEESFVKKFKELANSHISHFPSLKSSISVESEIETYRQFSKKLSPYVIETVSYLHNVIKNEKKKVLVEGANAAMLDIDFGTYPYVTSSNCSIGGVCTGLGLPPSMIGNVYGVVKAYLTRVGDGPFPTELKNETGAYLQKTGHEFGVTTGRPRRCGWLDIPMLRYTSMVNGYSAIALTKLDILDQLDEICIGVEYVMKDGSSKSRFEDQFPTSIHQFDDIESVRYVTLPGWKTSIETFRTFDELPLNAQSYVNTIEKYLGVTVRWIGVGQKRDAIIDRGFSHRKSFN